MWKIDDDEEHLMHSKSDKIQIMANGKADKFVEELFESVCNRSQNNFEKLIKSSEFVFGYVYLLYYKCHKINRNCIGSYVDSPNWIKNKKATINLINKKSKKCFQYAVTVELNYEVIRKYLQKNNKN